MEVVPYVEGHVDWPKKGVVEKTTTVASGDDLSDTWGKITDRFNEMDNKSEYSPINNNSNTAVAEGMEAAGFDFPDPSTPGIWDIEVPGEGVQSWDKFNKWLSENLEQYEKWREKRIEETIKESLWGFDPVFNQLYRDARNWRSSSSPIVTDLDGDGIETTGINGHFHTVVFDHDGDGVKTGTSWIKSDNALLALDRDGNGTIDNGNELFGNNTVLANGQKAADGYAALAGLDSNGDGILSALDDLFGQLLLWRDLDQDGVSDDGELGLTQIDPQKTENTQTLSDGTRLNGTGSVTLNGQTHNYTDAWFSEPGEPIPHGSGYIIYPEELYSRHCISPGY